MGGAAPRREFMIGEKVRHYVVEAKLGQGGMGEVYLVRDTLLGRSVALKFLPQELADDSSARLRFLREAKAAAAIDHPYVCKIYEAGQSGGRAFICTEFVEGEMLQVRIQRAPLSLHDALRIASEIAEAVAKAHERGVVHRDLKPANIILMPDGHVKAMDFGLALRVFAENMEQTQTALTQQGTIVGTVAYVSPEQLRGQEVDHRSDIFALGIVVYEMLTREHPFRRQTPMDTMAALLNAEPPPVSRLRPECPELLDRILGRALKKAPGERYSSVQELLRDLQRLKSAEQTRVAPRPRRSSIAVLPFRNLSPDPETEYFSDGIIEDILWQLAQIGDLKVISRTSVTLYKGVQKSLRVIGRELGVDTVLEGSVRYSGNRVRIPSTLVDVDTDQQLWSQAYNRELQDIFAIQAGVAAEIAGALKATISPAQRKRMESPRAADPEAYKLYLKGRCLMHQLTPASLQMAIRYYHQALEREPTHAPSFAAISTCFANSGHLGYLPGVEAFPKAKAAAEKALELDVHLAEAHASRALVQLFYDRDWQAAEKGFQQALALNPNYAEAHLFYSWYLIARRRFEESLAEAVRAMELDPVNLFAGVNVGSIMTLAGLFDQAIVHLRKTLELNPDYVIGEACLAHSLLGKSRFSEAVPILEKWNWTRLHLAQACALAGDRDKARQVAAEFMDAGQAPAASPFELAQLFFFLSESDRAYEWLEKAFAQRDNKVIFLGVLPLLESYRSEPRFQS